MTNFFQMLYPPLKRSVDNSKMFCALLTNLSKAFDCLDHELFTAKLNAYDFCLTALKLVHNYLTNRKQLAKINSTYNRLLEIVFKVPQGSILGPILFNIFLIDLFFIIEDNEIASNIDRIIKSLEEASENLFKWFNHNLMKVNADKCYLLVSTSTVSTVTVTVSTVKTKIGNFHTTNSKNENLLGVKFDPLILFR